MNLDSRSVNLDFRYMNLYSRSLSVSLLGSPGAGSASVPNTLEPEFEETGGSKIE